jgi:hypothetical protein
MCNSLGKYSNCIEFNDNRINIAIKDSSNPQTFRAKNSNRYQLICLKIDGCVIKNGEKADFLLCVQKDINDIYIIELKGKKLKDEIEQIIETIKFFNFQNINLKARIVFNKVPSGYDSEEKKLIKLLKQYSNLPANELYDRYKNGQKIEKV